MSRILNINLEAAPARLVSDAPETLVVFWAADRPVGQVYLTLGGEGASTAEIAEQAVDPIALERARNPTASCVERSVSVVICTRDRPDHLQRCLSSLRQQSKRPDQIIVVDNASVDARTREVAEQAGVVYVREGRPGLDIARNTGWRAAVGAIVAYTDDDVELHSRWLEHLCAAFDNEVMGVTGLVLPAELDTPAQRQFESFWGFGRGYRRIDFGSDFFSVDRLAGCPVWRIGAGASMAFRREVFDRIGGFDERLDVGAAGCSGDSEYWHRMLTHGMRLRYEPSSVAFHVHRREDAALASQIKAYMRGHTAALLVQFERSGHIGNLRRAIITLPHFYLRRLAACVRHGVRPKDHNLHQELQGWMSGLAFYLRTPRPQARP